MKTFSGDRAIRALADARWTLRRAPGHEESRAGPCNIGRVTSFRERVYAILKMVPRGRVVTYGQLALLAGHPRGAREVGWIAHAGGRGLPWQRVVNRFGGLAIGFTEGRAGHMKALRRDGVRVAQDFTVDLSRYQWWPDEAACRRLGLDHEVRARLTLGPGARPDVTRAGGQSGSAAKSPAGRGRRRRRPR